MQSRSQVSNQQFSDNKKLVTLNNKVYLYTYKYWSVDDEEMEDIIHHYTVEDNFVLDSHRNKTVIMKKGLNKITIYPDTSEMEVEEYHFVGDFPKTE
tara:strand:- start:241 stop:531 length:291 start_codon:yes stop_codon:yes gene_type:complete